MILHDTAIHVPGDPQTIGEIVDEFTLTENTSVYTYDTKRKKIKESAIGLTKTTSSKDFILIKTEDDDNLIITLDHKVYDPILKTWTRAQELKCGQHVLNIELEHIRVNETHRIRNTRADKVYTFSVPDYSCFFANNILIHNDYHYVQ